MSNRYTAAVSDKSYSFERFVWHCAKAFGPLGHMRDDDGDEPIRLPTSSSYYPERLVEAEATLERLQKMTLAQAEIEAEREHANIIKDAQEGIARRKADHQKFVTMLAKIDVWIPPTEGHQKLKAFMIDQLTREVRDSAEPNYYDRWLGTEKSTAKKWLPEAIQSAIDDVKRINKHIEDDRKNIQFSTEWIMQLQHSVPFPTKDT